MRQTKDLGFVPSEDSDQTWHLLSLIRIHCPHLKAKKALDALYKERLIRLGSCLGLSESLLDAMPKFLDRSSSGSTIQNSLKAWTIKKYMKLCMKTNLRITNYSICLFMSCSIECF